jgi:organic radical activating enzyme
MNTLEFRPDLIVEATNVCDRICPGCYAPNVVVEAGAAASAPGAVHLSLERLDQAWPSGERVGVVSIRGGEPTLNPLIGEIVGRISERAAAVYLETNGGWITPESSLLAVLAERGCIVKLSLDKMHGTSADEAARKLGILAAARVKTAVAVTESTREEFERACSRLLRGFQGEVIWQKKAVTQVELMRPVIGVIAASGTLKREVSNLLDGSPLALGA